MGCWMDTGGQIPGLEEKPGSRLRLGVMGNAVFVAIVFYANKVDFAFVLCCFQSMASSLPSLCLLVLLLSISNLLGLAPVESLSSPYLSPSLFYPNYQKMLNAFKIYIYHETQMEHEHQSESLFHNSLLKSPFVTRNGNEAHLFYLHVPPNSSYKSISRQIKTLQMDFPFWNRTLGADHFYVSCTGIGYESDRNIVELKKNSIQISCFPHKGARFQFIPHKDITLPSPLLGNLEEYLARPISTMRYIGYLRHSHLSSEGDTGVLIQQLSSDPDFLIESQPSNADAQGDVEKHSSSKFCLFLQGDISFSGIGKALRYGCVPVVITKSLVALDLPFMDVLRWMDIALFLETSEAKDLKNVLNDTCSKLKYEKMRELGTAASEHFVWNLQSPEPYDAFHMVLYQLWVRRHTIRYARRE